MSQNKKLNCLNSLRERILSTELEPGTDLDEVSLCEAYGMSRTPLREVLQRLSGEGFIQIEDNRGAKVASMDVSVMRTFFQTAPLIYANISALAAENWSGPQLDNLKAVQKAFAASVKNQDAAEGTLLNHRFHELIGEMAQNPYLTASLNRLLIDHTRMSQTFYRPQNEADQTRVAQAVEQHDAMIAAFESRETTLSLDLALKHWDLSRDQLERFVRPDPLPIDVYSLEARRHAV
ncbi:MAG: GntR family transcriptional regulator [Alphaproteobacteria bacterium]|mgnify:CR=1 FL=1